MDLSEGLMEGFFVGAKKGDRQWERPSGAKGRRSGHWQTTRVFLSPLPRQVLRRMKSPLGKHLSSPDWSPRGRHAWMGDQVYDSDSLDGKVAMVRC